MLFFPRAHPIPPRSFPLIPFCLRMKNIQVHFLPKFKAFEIWQFIPPNKIPVAILYFTLTKDLISNQSKYFFLNKIDVFISDSTFDHLYRRDWQSALRAYRVWTWGQQVFCSCWWSSVSALLDSHLYQGGWKLNFCLSLTGCEARFFSFWIFYCSIQIHIEHHRRTTASS